MVSAPVRLLHIRCRRLLEVVLGKGVETAEYDGFVDGEPVVHFGMVAIEDDSSVFGEIVDDVGREPAVVLVLQDEGEVPMVERDQRGDAVLETGVDDIVIVGKTGFIDGAGAEGKDARPGDGERVRFYANSSDSGDIYRISSARALLENTVDWGNDGLSVPSLY